MLDPHILGAVPLIVGVVRLGTSNDTIKVVGRQDSDNIAVVFIIVQLPIVKKCSKRGKVVSKVARVTWPSACRRGRNPCHLGLVSKVRRTGQVQMLLVCRSNGLDFDY